MEMDIWWYIAVAGAGLLAGFVNTVVGSGSLLTFPALLLGGMPPVVANVSNTVGLSVGNVMGVWGYRKELREVWRLAVPLLIVTVLAAIGGAFALLLLPPEGFSAVAPWLIAVGTVLVLVQPLVQPKEGAAAKEASPARTGTAVGLTALTGLYGGYFGAAQGVLIVGILGSLFSESTHTINALKNLLQTAAGFSAAAVFLLVGTIHWPVVIVLAVSSVVGALVGVRLGRLLPPWLFRAFVALVGIGSFVALLRG
ncbi:sulfite exporter TauE/SafE family protein [Leucobacter sp. UT-8R-CII-1-4]|uniref:sulfite exporter TauE/SafE family protein n=1 Tax=Leucobacter sp. UT-8R-CII-1-4 TaxID=3040075 RepID=UPI0024A8A51B|nr:sulfite exporter TauE/SafE family protein [Leucobacter sp. UT-8R-CII-1-4]MDI6023502.1 sulfite exporter TauE/SafE family protein [Leucobacter sp. UT-8R-CII-1-4]